MMTLQVDEAKCNGCGLCQAVCSMAHKKDEEVGQSRVSDLPNPLLWIDKSEDMVKLSVCRHCETPLCVDACVAGALRIDKNNGRVFIDRDKCVGCWSCVMECPFGALKIQEVQKNNKGSKVSRKAYKCDGCKEWDRPLCASFCPNGALKAERKENGLVSKKRRNRARIMGFGSCTADRVIKND